MHKLFVLGSAVFALSLHGQEGSSTQKQQPVEKADAGPYDNTGNDDSDNTDGTDSGDESQDEDVIQMDDEDSDSQ